LMGLFRGFGFMIYDLREVGVWGVRVACCVGGGF
jgi:hypothetical protein